MQTITKSTLIIAAGELWNQATHARFLAAIEDGTLPQAAFHRWLVQDYLFARGLVTFQAIATAKVPRAAQKVLIGGLTSLDAELDWFEQLARDRGLDLRAEALPGCRRYVDFLLAAAYAQPFQVLLAILYGVEASYLAAWGALVPAEPFAEFVERWSSPRFREYVDALREQADRHPHPQQQEAFNRVLRYERDFWRMTWEG